MEKFLGRVSKKKFITKRTAHTNFSDDALVNDEIKNGSKKVVEGKC